MGQDWTSGACRRGARSLTRRDSSFGWGAVLVCAALATIAFASPAAAQTAAPSPSEASTLAPSGPILPSSQTALTFVALAGLALFLVWVIPLSMDIRRAYRTKSEAWRTILNRLERDAAAGADGLTLDELKAFLPIVVRPPEGIRGLARVLLAFLITTLVAVLTLALLFSSAVGAFDIVKQIVTALLGVLATVIGFYFGARTAESASASTSPSAATGAPPGPGARSPQTDLKAGNAPQQQTGTATPPPEVESPDLM